jgi:hypothetical protein
MAALIKKRVGSTWTWIEDYVYLSATYLCFTPPDRSVQVGMGWFVNGTPLGEKKSISGRGEFTTIGFGAVHIRISDGGSDCEIAITQDRNTLVPILKSDF